MRFAYIDSNGNEVPIPSVDALALRIELGAITENTQLYDAQADQWGPAHTHEIFHTLSRAKDDGFVAPPPVAKAPAAPPPSPTRADPPAKEEKEAPTAGDFGLTLAEPEPAEEDDAGSGESDFGLTLADPLPGTDDVASGVAGAPNDDDAGAGGFDFGDLEGSLEVEDASEDDQPSFGGGLDLSGSDDHEPALDFSGGMELESAMDFSAGAGSGGTLDLEPPMSDFSPQASPAWMGAGGDEAEEDVLDFSSSADGAEGGDEVEVPLRERRTPRNKPSPPKLRKQRNLAGPMVAVVALLAVGLGGYVAWPVLSDRLASRGQPDEPAVFLPEIPADRMEEMRVLARAALARAVEQARTEWASEGRVEAPPREWLAGVYLANASRFVDVAPFWEDMADGVARARSMALADFAAAFAEEARRQGTGDEALLRERADSGFVAAAAARAEVFDDLQDLVDAALRLHEFLIANEDRIEYAPASTRTTDPVLEATATPEIRAAMEDLIDDVTRALSVIGYREAPSASGLWSNLSARVQERGVV